MGHVHSKKKRHKYNKELADYINRNVPDYHNNKHTVDPVDIDRISHYSEPFLQSSSTIQQNSTKKWLTMPITHDSREGSPLLKAAHISYKDIKVDDHPALTKLQNEQNTRLEKMEERMNQIRLHAMQEADRRKYAYLFRAKSRQSPTKDLIKVRKCQMDNYLLKTRQSPTNDLLLKAKDKIILNSNICDEKNNQKLQSSIDDKGEVIPVTVVTETKKSTTEIEKSKKQQIVPAFDTINLSDPKSVLLLPFLLPIFLLLFMVRSFAQSEKWKKDKSK